MGVGWKFVLFNLYKEEEWSGTSMASVLNRGKRKKFLKTILYEKPEAQGWHSWAENIFWSKKMHQRNQAYNKKE